MYILDPETVAGTKHCTCIMRLVYVFKHDGEMAGPAIDDLIEFLPSSLRDVGIQGSGAGHIFSSEVIVSDKMELIFFIMRHKSKKNGQMWLNSKKKYNFALPKKDNMSTNKPDKTEDRIVAVEEAFSKTEHFIESNQKIIMIVIGILIVGVLGFFGFKRYYLAPREKEAQSQMFMAEKYFEQDSLKKALNGDGNYLGFLDIIDQYGITKSANLSKYYAGICYLKMGEYQKAIEYLKKFSGKDMVVAPMANGAIGDAYMELNNSEEAISYYTKAADMRDNDFTTPLFLKKAGMAYEIAGKYDKALEMYKRIKDNYPRSYEGSEIDKYIAYVQGMIKK